MKLKLFFTALCLFTVNTLLNANNDKYRLILVDDPATTITVAFNQISGLNPTLYYDTIDYSTNINSYSFSKTVDSSTTAKGMENQFVKLTGLLPNTNYYFVIGDSEGVSERFWFKTAPSDNSRLFFIAGGDSRNNIIPRQNANLLVSKLKPHAVLFGGDMTNADSNTEWQEWFDDWQLTTASDGRMIPIVPTRGNHESETSIYDLFDTPNSDSYYAMTWGNNLVRTYTLNSEISVLGDQLTWLESDLANADDLTWKMAQYHKPMRPHTSGKSEGSSQYSAWAQLFYDENVKLVVDCDSHMSKTTWPIKPSSESGNDEGFVIDEANGTVYTGEGCWGAPLRSNDDDKSWTRNSGSFNQFKLIFIDEEKIELRTIDINNAEEVTELSSANTDPFTLPDNLNIFSPDTGAIVTISNKTDNPCAVVGTSCDDGDDTTINDEEDGFCNCVGILNTELEEKTITVANSADDAEENEAGLVDVTSTDLELIYDEGNQVVGVRFDNVEFPEGATLYRSYIQFEANGVDSDQDPTDLIINGELSATSEIFATTTNNISSRTLTSTAVPWNAISLWETINEVGINQRTPYLNSIVEEIVTQTEWVSGNALTFIFSGSGKRVASSFDGEGTAPILKLFYQTPCNPVGTLCDDGDETTTIDIEDGNCNCTGIKEEDTLTYQVNNGNDDAEESEIGIEMYIDSSDLELVFDFYQDQNNQTVGIRFNDILVPKGAIILNASIQFTVDETGSDPTSLSIRGERVPNSISFSETDADISNRTTTAASVNWTDVPAWSSIGLAGEDQKTPDLKSIVQEIVDQSGWEPFNAMTFLISGTGMRTAESYDGSSTGAPQLMIQYAMENTCAIYGTPCDDGDTSTINDEEDGFCNCVGVPDDVKEDTLLVISSSDDAEESLATGAVDITSSDLELIYDEGSQVVGVRFDNVQFPEGATLYRAYIQFQTDEDDSEEDPTNLIIHGELASASATFTSEVQNISSRTLTNTTALWSEISLWETEEEAGLKQRSPNVTAIVEEIVSQSDWESGNAVTFIFSGSGKRVAESFDGTAAPVLKLFYQTACNPKGSACDDGDETTLLDIEDGNCNCTGIAETGSLEYYINSSNNDAEEVVETGEMDLSSSDLELIAESGDTNQLVGIRFTDIHLPATAVITNAYVQFTVDDDNDGETNLIIHADATANSLIFSSEIGDISSRTQSVASVAWTTIPAWTSEAIGTADEAQRTPNLAVLVQEILGQSAWEVLNPMTFIISGSGEREAGSFDSGVAPKLVIEYTLSTLTLEDTILDRNFKMYPNPTKENVTLVGTSLIESFVIYDVEGRLITKEIIGVPTRSHQLNTSSLNPGVYYLTVDYGGSKITQKLIKM